MKRLRLAAAAVVAVALACATGCRPTPSGSAGNEFAVDSIGFSAAKDSGITCTIAVDYPQGDDSLAVGVRSFIARELAALYLPVNNAVDSAELAQYPVYSGSTADGQQLVDHYGNGVMRYLCDMRQELKAERLSDEYPLPPMSQKTTVSLAQTTPAYLTYRIVDDSYLGGAHPSHTAYSTNISRRTHRPVDHMVDAAKLSSMQPLLRQHVLQCLKESGVEGVTDATLAAYLILPDDGQVPLPVHSPWLEGDSLHFVYQQYEIASYAVGVIGFAVAVKDMKPYLAPEAAQLVEP